MPRALPIASPAAECPTVARLKTIRPGEKIVYYRGDFSGDLAACRPLPGREESAAFAVLDRIRRAAEELEVRGRAKLSTRSERRGELVIVVHVATGCAPRPAPPIALGAQPQAWSAGCERAGIVVDLEACTVARAGCQVGLSDRGATLVAPLLRAFPAAVARQVVIRKLWPQGAPLSADTMLAQNIVAANERLAPLRLKIEVTRGVGVALVDLAGGAA